MITLMTRASFLDSAADLETDLLYQTMTNSTELFMASVYGTYETLDAKDPSFKMWYGYEVALGAYVAALSAELATRGVKTTHHLAVAETVREIRRAEPAEFIHPPWFEDIDFLRSHRSNLIRRWPDQYGDVWKRTAPNMPYLWPFVDEEGGYALYISKADKALLASGERELPNDIRKRIQNL